MSDSQNFILNDADGGRAYIAHLFKAVLKRHDYRQYIAERLAGDFACTLAQYFEDIKAREAALQQRLTEADERVDRLKGLWLEWVNSTDQAKDWDEFSDRVVVELADSPLATCTWTQGQDSYGEKTGIWDGACGTTWVFTDDGPTENGMHFCHSCGKTLVVVADEPEPDKDDDWHMNPCKQGHRDVGASGGMAYCNTCDEKIVASTTQQAFEQWNSTHPASE